MNYKLKYLKYKRKYINLKNIQGGSRLAIPSTSRSRFRRRPALNLGVVNEDLEDAEKQEIEKFKSLKTKYEKDQFIEFIHIDENEEVNEDNLTRLVSQGKNSVMFQNAQTKNLVKRIKKTKVEEVKILINTMKIIKRIFQSDEKNCCFRPGRYTFIGI